MAWKIIFELELLVPKQSLETLSSDSLDEDVDNATDELNTLIADFGNYMEGVSDIQAINLVLKGQTSQFFVLRPGIDPDDDLHEENSEWRMTGRIEK